MPSSAANITATCWLADCQRDIKSLAIRRRDFGKINRHAAELHARRKSLHQRPTRTNSGAAIPSTHSPAGSATASVPKPISAEREQQSRAPPAMIDVSAQDDRAERPHQKTRAEGGERKHQRCELVARGKERHRDRSGVVAEDLKIVHLERVARRHADHGHESSRADWDCGWRMG